MNDRSNSSRRGFLPAGLAGFSAAALTAAQQGAPSSALPVFNVRDYRAMGDGRTIDTKAIQAAIDSCTRAGGGIVYFPAGRFLSGTITLKDNVTLHLSPGATLLGSQRVGDYPAKPFPALDLDIGGFEVWALVYADGAQNISIEGRGTIDGDGKPFPPKRPANTQAAATGARPRLLFLKNCRRVTVSDVTLQHAACWTAHFSLCDRVNIRAVNIHSDYFVNQDGIVIDSCQNVMISDCFVDTFDDAIVLKASYPQVCANISIANCVLTTRCAAIKFGTQSLGGFLNVSISNCTFYDCALGGLKFTAVDGGVLEDVVVSNIAMHNVAAPLFFRLGNRAQDFGFKDLPHPLPVSRVRNIQVSNVRATVAAIGRHAGSRPPAPRTGDTMGIMGLPGHPVENIVLNNIHVTFPGGGTVDEANKAVIPERPNAYPENTMFGVLPAYGFYLRHATGITMSNIRLELQTPDARPAFISDNVVDLELRGFVASGAAPAALIRLKDTRRALLQSCRPTAAVEQFLRVEGAASDNVALTGSDLRSAKQAIARGDGFTGEIQQTGNLI